MPFYEYECQACKFYTEVMQKISDPPLAKCPSCGKRRLKKLVSAPVFRLKGGGWYETDFKSDKENKRNLVGSEKEEPKGDSKPDAKDGKSEAKEAKPAAKEGKSDVAKAAESKPATPKPSTSVRRPPSTAKRKSRRTRR
jgi:putative FmdB family regulatory protein